VGATDAALGTGWLGRYLDATGTSDNPLQGLTLGDTLSPALAAAKVPVATLSAPDEYDFRNPGVFLGVQDQMFATLASGLGGVGSSDPAFAQVGNTAVQVSR